MHTVPPHIVEVINSFLCSFTIFFMLCTSAVVSSKAIVIFIARQANQTMCTVRNASGKQRKSQQQQQQQHENEKLHTCMNVWYVYIFKGTCVTRMINLMPCRKGVTYSSISGMRLIWFLNGFFSSLILYQCMEMEKANGPTSKKIIHNLLRQERSESRCRSNNTTINFSRLQLISPDYAQMTNGNAALIGKTNEINDIENA